MSDWDFPNALNSQARAWELAQSELTEAATTEDFSVVKNESGLAFAAGSGLGTSVKELDYVA